MQRCSIRRRLMSWRRFCNHSTVAQLPTGRCRAASAARASSLTGGTPLPQPIISHWRAANETGELRGHFVDVGRTPGEPHYADKIVRRRMSQHLAAPLKDGIVVYTRSIMQSHRLEALLTFVYTGCCSIEEAEPALLKAAASCTARASSRRRLRP